MSSRRMSLCVRVIAVALVCVASLTAQSVPEVLYYKFNEGSGSSTANLAMPGQGAASPSITGHTLTGSGGLNASGSLLGVTEDNGNNRVNTGWTPNLGSGSWTVGFYLDVNGIASGDPSTLMYVMGDPTTSWRIYANSSAGAGNVRMRGPISEIGSSGGPLNSGGRYFHFVYNASNGQLALYVDGVLDNAVAQSGIDVSGTGNLQVGGYTGGGSPESLRSGVNFDEFRIYNRALTASEVSATWNVSLSPFGVVPDFSADVTSGGAPLTVNFTDTSTTTEPGGVTSWVWNFGDGNTSTQQNPTHTYMQPGSYTVSLTAGDGVNPNQTRTYPNLITSDGWAFDVSTTGVGDLVINAAPNFPGTSEGFTLFSTTPAAVIGQGNFFGINFDDQVVQSLTSPAFINNPLHWIPAPSAYPNVPFVLPPGTLNQYAGVTADAIAIYIVNGQIVTSIIDRVTF